MTITVLRAGIDTLEVSYRGDIDVEKAERLDSLKVIAQADNAPAPIKAGLFDLLVRDKAFGFWRWVLTNPEFHLRLALNAKRGSPSAQVRLSAFGLVNQDPSLLLKFASHALSEFGEYEEHTVSRMDVAVDFQGYVPTIGDMAGMVCDAAFRPIYPSIDNPQTFQFGKGARVARLYNKTEEMNGSDKRWLEELWQMTGRYDRTLPVWRFEIQLRRQALKEYGIHSSAQAFSKAQAAMDKGLDWANLRIPSDDGTKTRWVEHPAWTELRRASYDGPPLLRAASLPVLLPLDQCVTRLLSLVATVAAREGIEDYDGAMAYVYYVLLHELKASKKEFRALVDKQARRILDSI